MPELASSLAAKPSEIVDPVTGERHLSENVEQLVSVFEHLVILTRKLEAAKDEISLALHGIGDEVITSRARRARLLGEKCCTVTQKVELRRLREMLALSTQQWRELLELHGVKTAHDLSTAQANELLRLLQLRCRRLHSTRDMCHAESHASVSSLSLVAGS